MNKCYWDEVLFNMDDRLVQQALTGRQRNAAGTQPGYKPKKTTGRISRTALIAAVIASFMVVSALAATLWKLSDRSISAAQSPALVGEAAPDFSWLSLAGVKGSDEYASAREWLHWSGEYLSRQEPGWIDDDWIPADPEMEKSAIFYMCFDDTMAQKLKETAEKYGLRLHTESVTPIDIEQLYELSGTAEFLLADDFWAVPKYIYEDGSFDIEGTDHNGKLFSLIRSMSGTLPASQILLWKAENATEWTYTNFSGDELSMAITETRGGGFCSYIFYSENDAHIVLATELGDRARIESLADCFDFSAACGGETQVMDYVNAPPRAAAPAQAADLSAFAESPEYKAMREFMDFRRLQGALLPYYKGIFPVSQDSLYSSLDEAERSMLEAMEHRVTGEKGICPTYGLSAHSSYTEHFDYYGAIEAAGTGDFVLNAREEFYNMRIYEDGSFDMNEGFFFYIKKGALCTTTHQVVSWLKMEDYAESWQYETASGAVVCCALGTNQGSLILFETATAWVLIPADGNIPPRTLEALAECYDFTQLP